jgi:hypothetical protein
MYYLMVREYCRYGNTYCFILTKNPTKIDHQFMEAYPFRSCIVTMYKFDKIYKKTLKDTFSAYFAKFAQKGPSLTVKSGFYNKLIFEKIKSPSYFMSLYVFFGNQSVSLPSIFSKEYVTISYH